MNDVYFTCQEGEIPYLIHLQAVLIGADLVVMIGGGTHPHVGAVAVSIPRPSLADPLVTSATTSVYALVGHKEDDLAKTLAHQIASTLQRKTVMTVGIHVEGIPPEGIATVKNNCQQAITRLLGFMKNDKN